jgi:hypothetical protein
MSSFILTNFKKTIEQILKTTKNISLSSLVMLLMISVSGMSQEICNNGIDDDNDGLIDCYDADCFSSIDCDDFYYGGGEPSCDVTYIFNPDFGLTNVWTSPAVVNGNVPLVVADLDGDGIPEVVASRESANVVNIINGKTGEIQLSFPAYLHPNSQGLSVVDADNDGNQEIYLVNTTGVLYGYQASGIGIPGFQNSAVGYDVAHATWHPQFADFDEDGTPELYLGNQIFSYNGAKLAEAGSSASRGVAGGDLTTILFEHSNTVAADVLPDDFCSSCEGLELVCGNEVYSVNNNNGTWTLNLESSIASKGNYNDGKTSIADWNGDGKLDVIVASVKDATDAFIYIWNPIDTTLMSNSADGGSLASNPFNPNSLLATSIFSSRLGVLMIADLDGDGQPEIGGVGKGAIFVLDHKLTELWSIPVNNGEGINSMTSFDFEGDGSVEILYQTLDSVLVLDAKTGVVKTSYSCSSKSSSTSQMPVIADVTADGQANIICACGDAALPTYSEVHVLNSVTNDWRPTRNFWNQFNISSNIVNDDIQILTEAQDPTKIKGHNNFLVQTPFLATNGNLLWKVENCDSVRLIISEDGVNNDWYPEYGNVTPGTCSSDGNINSLKLDYTSNIEDVELRSYSATGVGDLTSLDFSLQTSDFNQDLRVQILDTAGVILVDTLFAVTTQNEVQSLDLSVYSDGNVLLKSIKLEAENNASFCIDYIKFTKTKNDVFNREVNLNNLNFTVVDGGVEIKSKEKLSNVLVYNMAGALVKTMNVNAKEMIVQTSNLSKGIYMFEVVYKDKFKNNHIKVALK